MIKYTNFIILLSLVTLGVLLKGEMHLSTNLLSLFATKQSVEKLKIANNLGYSKEILFLVKGLDREAQKELKEITKKLEKIDAISYVQSTIIPTQEIQNYYKTHYPLLAAFDNKELTQEEVRNRLEKLYNAQLNSLFYTAVDRDDPLSLFHLENLQSSQITHKGNYITLGSYGYLIRAMSDVTPSQMREAKELYSEIQSALLDYPDVVAFAPFFYTVENSNAIEADVSWIVLLSTIVLLLVYYLLIKNLKLLLQTIVALASSMLFASLVSMLFVENFNLLSLAFGMSLSAISIDYLLHYHFHNFYQGAKKIDKNVLYGYLTTVVAFAIFSFIPIPLIAQISLFALLSLSFAYMLFTFVFPILKIEKYTPPPRQAEESFAKIPALGILFVSISLLLYSAYHFKLDSNIRNLDYQNMKLQSAQKLFQESSQSKLTPIVVQAPTQEELLHNLHLLKSRFTDTLSLASFVQERQSCQTRKRELESFDFKRVQQAINEEAIKVGFREGYFKEAYGFTSHLADCSGVALDIFKSYGLSLYHDGEKYYTIAFVDDAIRAEEFAFVSSIDVKKMFENSAKKMYDDLLEYGLIVLGMIFLLLLVSVKKRFIYALNYILFPMSVTLSILLTLGTINIMHLFSLIILVAIGIDYGIYMSNSKKQENTKLAIKYSLLSTFAAFGVLVFSSIVALNSIGIVISLGCGAIFVLIKTMK